MIFGIVMLLILTACTSQPTGKAITELNHTNSSKPAKFTVPDDPLPKKSVNNTQSCSDQIKTLQEQKIQDEYDLLQVKGDKQKISREIQYKKENQKHKKEVEQLLEQLKQLGKQSDTLAEDIDDKKKAIRLLAEKCGIKL